MSILTLVIFVVAGLVIVAAVGIVAFAFYRTLFGAHRPGALADRAIRQADEMMERTLEMQEEIERKAVLRRVRCEYCDSTVDMAPGCPNCGAALPE